MLVLSRKKGEKIVCEDVGLTLTVVDVHGGRVKLGIEAPQELRFLREEVELLRQRLAQLAQPVQRVA